MLGRTGLSGGNSSRFSKPGSSIGALGQPLNNRTNNTWEGAAYYNEHYAPRLDAIRSIFQRNVYGGMAAEKGDFHHGDVNKWREFLKKHEGDGFNVEVIDWNELRGLDEGEPPVKKIRGWKDLENHAKNLQTLAILPQAIKERVNIYDNIKDESLTLIKEETERYLFQQIQLQNEFLETIKACLVLAYPDQILTDREHELMHIVTNLTERLRHTMSAIEVIQKQDFQGYQNRCKAENTQMDNFHVEEFVNALENQQESLDCLDKNIRFDTKLTQRITNEFNRNAYYRNDK